MQLLQNNLPGATVEHVLAQLADEATTRILDRAFGPALYSADAPDGATWQTKQIWRVMRELCASKDRSLHNGVERESLDYNTVLLKLFKGDERAVQGLVEQQLLSVWHNEPWRDANGVVHDNGSRISAASPLVQVSAMSDCLYL